MKKNGILKSAKIKNQSRNQSNANKLLKELRLKEKYYDIKDYAEKIHKANSKKIKENKIRNDEITSLNDNIHKLMIANYNLEEEIKKRIKMREQYEKEQKEISEYCNDLREKYKQSNIVFNNYEEEIKYLKKKYEDTQKLFDNKIEEIALDNEKLNKKINDRLDLFTKQKNQIIETKGKIERLQKELNDQNNLITNRGVSNKIKLLNLKEEYEELKKKLSFMELEYYREKTLPSTNVSLNTENKNIEKKSNRTYDNNNNDDNNYLLTQINELSKKYIELSTTSRKHSKKTTSISKGKTTTKYKSINTFSKTYY